MLSPFLYNCVLSLLSSVFGVLIYLSYCYTFVKINAVGAGTGCWGKVVVITSISHKLSVWSKYSMEIFQLYWESRLLIIVTFSEVSF